ncbi:MAG: hypothetical protein AABY64_11205 [Bdellovibrionota bacterium]
MNSHLFLVCIYIWILGIFSALPLLAGANEEKIKTVDSPAMIEYVCKNDKNKFEKICTDITKICQKKFNSNDCSIDNLSDLDEKGYTSYFISRLRKMTLKTKKINICCGEDQDCSGRLANTNVQILKGTKSTAGQYGYYHYKKEYVGIYKDALLKLGTKQNIDAFLHHEFGHACAQSINPDHFDMNSAQTINYIKERFKAILDEPTYKCIFAAIEKQAKARTKKKLKVDKASWYEEAFADLAFAYGRKNIANYAIDCHYKEDERHAQPAIYLKCYLQSKTVYKKYCDELDERPLTEKASSEGMGIK